MKKNAALFLIAISAFAAFASLMPVLKWLVCLNLCCVHELLNPL